MAQRVDLLAVARHCYRDAQDRFQYHLGVDALYTLCRRAPRHDDVNGTQSKLWLIGRSHSASLERRRDSDGYPWPYLPTARRMSRGKLDRLLDIARSPSRIYTLDHLCAIRTAVDYLASLFEETTGLWKVSLASKYLHFHVPAVPIFDSLSAWSLRRLVGRAEVDERHLPLWRMGGYGRHIARFATVYQKLHPQKDYRPVSARSIDTFLLYWYWNAAAPA